MNKYIWLLLIFCLLSCSTEEDFDSKLTGIIGLDDREYLTAPPYLGMLSIDGPESSFCNAFAVGEYSVITASHCISGLDVEKFARLKFKGKYDISHSVATLDQDLAILVTVQSIPVSDRIEFANESIAATTNSSHDIYLEGFEPTSGKYSVSPYGYVYRMVVSGDFLDAPQDIDGIFIHSFDTLPGYSGSPIVVRDPSGLPRVAGVHLGFSNELSLNIATSNLSRSLIINEEGFNGQLESRLGFGWRTIYQRPSDCESIDFTYSAECSNVDNIPLDGFDEIAISTVGSKTYAKVSQSFNVYGRSGTVSTTYEICPIRPKFDTELPPQTPIDPPVFDPAGIIVEVVGISRGDNPFEPEISPPGSIGLPNPNLDLKVNANKSDPSIASIKSKKILDELKEQLESSDLTGCSPSNSKSLPGVGSCAPSHYKNKVFKGSIEAFDAETERLKKGIENLSWESANQFLDGELNKANGKLQTDLAEIESKGELNSDKADEKAELESLQNEIDEKYQPTESQGQWKTSPNSSIGRKVRSLDSYAKSTENWLKNNPSVENNALRQDYAREAQRAASVADNEAAGGEMETAEVVAAIGLGFADLAAGIALGPAKSLAEVIAGKNLITGEEYTGLDYVLAFVDIASLGTAGAVIKTGKFAVNTIKTAHKFLAASKNAKNVAAMGRGARRAAKAVDELAKKGTDSLAKAKEHIKKGDDWTDCLLTEQGNNPILRKFLNFVFPTAYAARKTNPCGSDNEFISNTVSAKVAADEELIKKFSELGDNAPSEVKEVLSRITTFKPKSGVDVTDLGDGVYAYTKDVEGLGNVTVEYSKYGFPDFSPFLKKDLSSGQKNTVRIRYTGSRSKDFAEANRLAGIPGRRAPKGYTWHHNERIGVMELVDSRIHNVGTGGFAHTGGVRIWEEITGLVYKN